MPCKIQKHNCQGKCMNKYCDEYDVKYVKIKRYGIVIEIPICNNHFLKINEDDWRDGKR